MKAMILAAGRGERMRPLSDTIPKPLLHVNAKPLILYHIEKLASKGFKEIVINIAHLGQKIIDMLGDGSKWGVKIHYSDERESGALESAGGIKNALSILGEESFLVVNGDIFCSYEFDAGFELGEKLAHLVLVPNPAHNPQGDFGLDEEQEVVNKDAIQYTFSGIGYYNPKLFTLLDNSKKPLAPLLREAIKKRKVSGELYSGEWHDIGTPQRLEEINNTIKGI